MSYRGLHRREGSGEFGNQIEPHDFSRGSSQNLDRWLRGEGKEVDKPQINKSRIRRLARWLERGTV